MGIRILNLKIMWIQILSLTIMQIHADPEPQLNNYCMQIHADPDPQLQNYVNLSGS